MSHLLYPLQIKINLKVYFTVFLLFASNFLASSQETNRKVSNQLTVTLLDSIGQPISGATINRFGKGTIAISDKNGNFSLSLKEPIKIEIRHINFETLSKSISKDVISSDQTVHWVLKKKPQFLDAITVTDSTVSRELRQVASSVSVLQNDDPELRQIQSIDEALAFIPGVMVDRNRGLTTTGTHTGVVLRGTGAANRTLVMKDGVPINDAYIGGVSEWNSLAANSIERIEVIRGPGSSIYGSSSMGGTINLITQSPTERPVLGAEVRYGSMNTFQASAKAGKKFGKRFGAIAFAEYKRTDGYQYMADDLWKEYYQKPKMALLNVNSRLTYNFENGGILSATADFNTQEPLSGTTTLYDDYTFTGNYQVRYKNMSAKFAPDVLMYYNVQNRTSQALNWNIKDNQYNTENYNSHIPLDTYGVIAKVSHNFWNNDLTIGADLRFTEVVSKKNYANKGDQNFNGRQDFISFFLNDDVSITQKLHVNLGLRFDHWANRNGYFSDDISEQEIIIQYDDATSSVWTPKIGLTYDVRQNFRLRSVYATGFRAPGAYYMYNSTALGSSFRLGNPALKPERMKYSLELGTDWKAVENLELSGTVYTSQYSDFLSAILIDASQVPDYFDPGNLPVRQYINIGKVNLWGLESSLKYQVSPSLSVQGSYFHNQSKIKRYETNPGYEGKQMNDNPNNIYSGAIIYDNPKIGQASFWARHSSSYFGDLENTEEKRMDAVSLFDLKLARQIGPVGLNFTVNNLFDKQYYGTYSSPTSYYFTPGRTLLLGINYQL